MKLKKKRTPLLLMAFCLIAMPLLCGIPEALADNDDFNPNYDFKPGIVGTRGGDVELQLTVENTGDTDITWLGVGIDTRTPYTQKWVGHPAIHPGTTRRLSFIVPFMAADLDETRRMQVTMNNDGDAMSDGSKTFRFIIRSKNIFTVTASVSNPSGGGLRAGDTAAVTIRFKNNMTTAAATGVVTDAYLKKDGLILNNPPDVNQGIVMPGETKTMSFTYDLRDYDVGELAVHYKLIARMLGRDYDLSNVVLYFNVAEAITFPAHTLDPGPPSSEPERSGINFTARLSAEPAEIDPGDTVSFRVTVENTGDGDIGGFEIRNAEGGLELEVEGMDSGDAGSVVISREITESCDVSFVVIGRTGDDSVSKETNTVHITVRGEETASPSVSGGETAPPFANVSAAQTQGTTPEPSASASGTPEATEQAIAQVTGIPTEVLLIAIAVLLAAILALIIVLILRGRKPKQQQDE